jgi:hypothetical protein
MNAADERTDALGVDRLGLGKGRSAIGTAVVRSLEDDDIGLVGRSTGDFESGFDGFGSRAASKRLSGSVNSEVITPAG